MVGFLTSQASVLDKGDQTSNPALL